MFTYTVEKHWKYTHETVNNGSVWETGLEQDRTGDITFYFKLLVMGWMFMSLQNSYVEVLVPNMTEVIKVRGGHEGGVLMVWLVTL